MDEIKRVRSYGEGQDLDQENEGLMLNIPKPGRLLAARSFAGSRSDKSTKQKPRPCRIYRQQFI
jgi:hypothetical protein